MIKVQNITKVRDGLWFISYTHECDCGCKTTRHNLTYSKTTKPSLNKAKQLADADYNSK